MTARLRHGVALASLFGAAVALRAAFVISYAEDIDALRFLLAVERFDVAELRPHAPYYPVYIALAKVVHSLGASPATALGVVGALSGAAVVALTALLARELLGTRGALVAGALALASPFLWLTSLKLLSDMTGAALTTAALWLAARARRLPARAPRLHTAALVTLGIGLGARLSYFPFAIGTAWLATRADAGPRAWLRRARDVAFGLVLWLVPLVLVASPRALVAVTWTQGIGHFSRWGGSIVTVPSPAARLSGLAWGAWANLLGGAWIDAPRLRWIALPALVAVLAAGLCLARARALPPAVRAPAALYLAWVLVGQNVADKPRHLLPLLPVLIVLLAAGALELLARSRAAALAIAALAVLWLADGAALARAHLEPSPAAALVAHLASSPTEPAPVVTRDLERLIREGAPATRVIAARSDADLLRAVGSTPGPILVTSEALSSAARASLEASGRSVTTAFARPRSRYVDSLWYELALLRVAPAYGATP
jgi:hypothetical protein